MFCFDRSFFCQAIVLFFNWHPTLFFLLSEINGSSVSAYEHFDHQISWLLSGKRKELHWFNKVIKV